MTGWMIYNIEDYNKNKKYFEMHKEIADKNDIKLELKFMENFSYGVNSHSEYFILYDKQRVELPQFVIGRMRNPMFTKQLELMGVDVYNNAFVADICNDKAKTYQFLAGSGTEVIPSEFVSADVLDNKIERLNAVSEEENQNLDNKVIKSTSGHGGTEVFLASDYPEAHFPTDVVVQPFVQGENADVRVYVLDNAIVSAVKRTAKEGFKSNYSLGGDVEEYILSKEERVVVDKIIAWFNKERYLRDKTSGLFYVGVDFIIDREGKFLFNEIEDVVGSRMLYKTSNIDIVQMYMNKIVSRYL